MAALFQLFDVVVLGALIWWLAAGGGARAIGNLMDRFLGMPTRARAVAEFSEWEDVYGRYEYRSQCGTHRFVFELVKMPGEEVRVYIVEQPEYGRRKTDGHSTHRLLDGTRRYVCIRGDLTPRTAPDAITWAIYWAECTSRYIRTGRGFS